MKKIFYVLGLFLSLSVIDLPDLWAGKEDKNTPQKRKNLDEDDYQEKKKAIKEHKNNNIFDADDTIIIEEDNQEPEKSLISECAIESINDAAKEETQDAFLEKYPNASFLDLENIVADPYQVIEQDDVTFLRLTKSDLDKNKNELIQFLEKNNQTHFVLDVSQQSGDFVDQNGTLNLSDRFNLFFQKIQKLTITNKDRSILSIGNSFLAGFKNLITLDLSFLSSVTNIGNNFLSCCSNLTALDLTAFYNLISIGNGFLSGNRNFTTLDLSSFTSLERIGNAFLYDFSNLVALDLSSLSSLARIGDAFLYGCNNLKTLDLSAICNVTRIGRCFLGKCENLKTLDLRPFSNVAHIGDGFFKNDFLVGCQMYSIILPEDPDLPLNRLKIDGISIQDVVVKRLVEAKNKWIEKLSNFVLD